MPRERLTTTGEPVTIRIPVWARLSKPSQYLESSTEGARRTVDALHKAGAIRADYRAILLGAYTRWLAEQEVGMVPCTPHSLRIARDFREWETRRMRA